MSSLGLYVHIPFCKSKCVYCDFYSLPRREDAMDAYTAVLAQRLRAADTADFTVDTIYFGGGTPSYLGAQRLCALLETIKDSHRVAPDAEITLEANPDSAQDVAALRALRDSGFTRISLGMQSADDAILRAIGRIHTHAQTVRAVENARVAGFADVSLDLIYGLPYETTDGFLSSLDAALSLAPEHLSCYGLKVEEGTPLAAMDLPLPDDDAQAERYLAACDRLAARGYEHYEISNFCRPGHPSRHNLRYWRLSPYLGFGPGAHSDFRGERFAVARDLDAYLRGDVRCSERAAVSPAERERERVMLALRTSDGLAEASLSPAVRAFFEECIAHGLALRDGARVRLTARGWLVSNEIIRQVLGMM